ncbi:hypothetical protein ACHAWF_000767 [Thalassiosira exigua]
MGMGSTFAIVILSLVHSPMILVLLVASCVRVYSFIGVQVPPSLTPRLKTNTFTPDHALFMAKRKKLSMKERRKQRAKRQPGFNVDPGLLNDLPPVDSWEKDQPTMVPDGGPCEDVDESEETVAKASSLVQSQRKSVDCLTFIRKRVEESFPIGEAAKQISTQGYFVHDGFLSGDNEQFGDALISEMLQEGSDMLAKDKLERDISRLGDGEYTARIVGGEAYADLPRMTEFIVSLTRHLPPLLNEEFDGLDLGTVEKLDSSASMGTLRLYDRKTRLSAETLLMKPEGDDHHVPDRPFGVICGDNGGVESDMRRLTAMFFVSSKDWDESVCGGGVTMEHGEKLDAIRDRIVLMKSDTCSHREEPWKGNNQDGCDQASCVTVHFVKATPSS